MEGIRKSTSERPPAIMDFETKVKISPMSAGAKNIKEFLESKQKGEKKMTRKEAAKALGLAEKTINNKLTKGHLKGDGQGGVTDESVEAWRDKQQAAAKKLAERQEVAKELAVKRLDEITESLDTKEQKIEYADEEDQVDLAALQETQECLEQGEKEKLAFASAFEESYYRGFGKLKREAPEWLIDKIKKAYLVGYGDGYEVGINEEINFDFDKVLDAIKAEI